MCSPSDLCHRVDWRTPDGLQESSAAPRSSALGDGLPGRGQLPQLSRQQRLHDPDIQPTTHHLPPWHAKPCCLTGEAREGRPAAWGEGLRLTAAWCRWVGHPPDWRWHRRTPHALGRALHPTRPSCLLLPHPVSTTRPGEQRASWAQVKHRVKHRVTH